MHATIGKVMARCIIFFFNGHHQVIENFVIHYKMNCSSLLNCCIGMEKRRGYVNLIIYFNWGVWTWDMWACTKSQRLSKIEWIYLGEITRYTIFASIFANKNKCCTLRGLAVKGWHTLVTNHYKYIVSSCNGIIIVAIT